MILTGLLSVCVHIVDDFKEALFSLFVELGNCDSGGQLAVIWVQDVQVGSGLSDQVVQLSRLDAYIKVSKSLAQQNGTSPF